jgi:hypothetical protein
MTTPSLWVHLSLCSAEHQMAMHESEFESLSMDGSNWYSSPGRVVCHDTSELNTIVSRAGSLPLDIHLSYRSDNTPVIHSVLGDTSIARRIASLEIDGYSPPEIDSFHEVAGVTIGSFPLLHTLTICSIAEELQHEILESLSRSSPHFRYLKTHRSIASCLDFSFWPKLRSLNLSRGSTEEVFNNLVPHLGELEILGGCPPDWPNSSTPEVTFAKLTTLEVFCLPEYLRRLRLPALLNLVISEVYSDAQIEPNGEPLISLPVLEILDVDIRTTLSWLAILSAPCLRIFILRQTGLSPDVEASLFQNIRFPKVQDFTLNYSCTDQLAISVLECVPNAEKVALSSTTTLHYHNPWGRQILQRLADAENMLCPHVTHFTLGSLRDGAIVNKTWAKDHAQRAIKNRMDGGVKMDHFEIRFKTRGESIQYA